MASGAADGEAAGGRAAHGGGLQVDDRREGLAVDVEEDIGEGFEVGDAAEGAALVEVVDEDDGDAGFIGDVAQLVEGVQKATGVVLQPEGGEAGERVQDDKTGAAFEDEVVEQVALAFGGEAPVVEGSGEEAGEGGQAQAAGEEGEAAAEGGRAEIFIEVEDGGGADGMAQPGQALRDVQGEVEHEVGFAGGGVADEQGDGTSGQETPDEPGGGEGRRERARPGGGDADAQAGETGEAVLVRKEGGGRSVLRAYSLGDRGRRRAGGPGFTDGHVSSLRNGGSGGNASRKRARREGEGRKCKGGVTGKG